MSNLYYTPGTLSKFQLARAEQVNAQLQAIEQGFDLLPAPTAFSGGILTYTADTGVADAYVAALPTTILSYAEGQEAVVKIANTNTGACTLNIDGLGARAIKLTDGSDPRSGDLLAGQIALFRYDGTNFQMLSVARGDAVAAEADAAAAAASAAAAATSETNAATSETSAASSASAAATSAGNAATSAGNAATSETNAAASAAAAAAVDLAMSMEYLDTISITSNTTAATFAIPAEYNGLFISFRNFSVSTSNGVLLMRLSTSGTGGPFISTTTYFGQGVFGVGASVSAASTSGSGFTLTNNMVSTAIETQRPFGHYFIRGLNTPSGFVSQEGITGGVDTGNDTLGTRHQRQAGGGYYDAFQLLSSSGDIATLEMEIHGLKNG